MNKRLTVFSLLFSVLIIPVFAEYPPAGWTDSITDAIALAEREEKMILLDFTGSDWCTWCKKLEAEVWDTPEFRQWSQENLVKVFLDFPQGITLSEEVSLQNHLLQQYFGVRGYPTVFILDSKLTPLLRTGYRQGGPEEYIRHIREDRNLRVDSPEDFQAEFKEVIEEYIGPIGSAPNPPE